MTVTINTHTQVDHTITVEQSADTNTQKTKRKRETRESKRGGTSFSKRRRDNNCSFLLSLPSSSLSSILLLFLCFMPVFLSAFLHFARVGAVGFRCQPLSRSGITPGSRLFCSLQSFPSLCLCTCKIWEKRSLRPDGGSNPGPTG